MLALEGEVTCPLIRKSLKYEGRQAKWGEQGGNGAIEIERPGRLMSPENAQAFRLILAESKMSCRKESILSL